jgi:hypothetical protein
LLPFKKTSNNLSNKQKPIWRVNIWLPFWQLFLMIMSNGMWNTNFILSNQNQFLNKNPFRH